VCVNAYLTFLFVFFVLVMVLIRSHVPHSLGSSAVLLSSISSNLTLLYRNFSNFKYTKGICSEYWIVLHVQSQHDYMLGNYPVGRDDAAQLAALQILADIGPLPNPEATTYVWNPNVVKVNHYL
jgi:hypothetical protein